MSHGGGDESVEPDLTALLDLVMQMLMFFIINVNFVSEQVSPDIKLPTAESARPVDKADPAALFLNQKMLTEEFRNKLTPEERQRFKQVSSVVLIPGLPPKSLSETRTWLKDKAELLMKLSPDGKLNTVIHFRPDGDLELNDLFQLMKYCETAGFTRLKVRATVKRGS